MKERPILFSGPMVRAILEGRKTVTRRAIKRRKRSADTNFSLVQQQDGSWLPYHTFDESLIDEQGSEHPIACPFGQVGDRLWVRETWAGVGNVDPGYLTYRATYPACLPPNLENVPADLRAVGERWRPSIHMPRAASRILLEITDVRVERLQDISGDQAEAEGVDSALCRQFFETSPSRHECKEAVIHGFAGLWASINGAESWHANPWVWVVEFRKVLP
ncbi:hypothetical protein [Pseudomonas rhizoryzae]|uniref:hypothetical protein n=1 Tax=Pseudomonas rhizoryzae TaxID=2571129 RepID=UPI0010C1A020|nr:hypothetical protein [Pseudomonas rhizoryzae]